MPGEGRGGMMYSHVALGEGIGGPFNEQDSKTYPVLHRPSHDRPERMLIRHRNKCHVPVPLIEAL